MRPVLILTRHEPNIDLVDEAELAAALDLSLRLLRFVRSNEVLDKGLANHFEPGLDRVRVIGCAVLAEQELQHVHGDVRPNLDLADQVLADHAAGEDCV